jgi:hypothetical protein
VQGIGLSLPRKLADRDVRDPIMTQRLCSLIMSLPKLAAGDENETQT